MRSPSFLSMSSSLQKQPFSILYIWKLKEINVSKLAHKSSFFVYKVKIYQKGPSEGKIVGPWPQIQFDSKHRPNDRSLLWFSTTRLCSSQLTPQLPSFVPSFRMHMVACKVQLLGSNCIFNLKHTADGKVHLSLRINAIFMLTFIFLWLPNL